MKNRDSCGIILAKKLPGKPLQFLLVKNRVSNEFSEIIRKPAALGSGSARGFELLSRTTFYEKQLLASGDAKAVARHLIPVRPGEPDWPDRHRKMYKANYKTVARNEAFRKQLMAAPHSAIPWVAPRGRPQTREEPRATALRELREETNVDLEHVLVDMRFQYQYSVVEYDVSYRFSYYLAITGTDVQPSLSLSSSEQVCELGDMAFMTLQRAKEEAPDVYPMLRVARQYLRNTYPHLC